MHNEVIKINKLSKWYDIYASPKDILIEFISRKSRHTKFWALKDISLSITEGEIVGIIGKNGAGKSTLLKIIAGLLSPSDGELSINRSCRAIMELGTGFNDEQTGVENIYLGGISIGLTKRQIKERLPWIIEFSGLDDFLERPVKTYSSGMRSRLAFAVAFCVRPELLIIDEALSVGDQAFVAKCTKHISDMCREGGTAIIVSHNMYFLQEKCSRVIYINNGVIVADGAPHEVCKQHELDMAREFVKENNKAASTTVEQHHPNDYNELPDSADLLSREHGWVSLATESIGDVKLTLDQPFSHYSDKAYSIELPDLANFSDSELNPEASPLLLFEDDKLLGPAHCEHANISQVGTGSYSHWKSSLLFSASDNSNPNTNKRRYRIELHDKQLALRMEAEANLPSRLRKALKSGSNLNKDDFEGINFLRPLQLATLTGVRVINAYGELVETISCGQSVTIQAMVNSRVHWPNTISGFQLFDSAGNMIVSSNTAAFIDAQCQPSSLEFDLLPGNTVFSMDIPAMMLGAGMYTLAFGMSDITRINHNDEKLIYERPCLYMSVTREDFIQNVSYEPAVTWSIEH
ncbi:ABC transporter ATP-binding protein [Maridesulfovibrio sp.]|uniref:ABC transporter ATP-binding protein n=1 Tax=Maridesulfovibrio sp. TaxID=2795000 RepID=UPI003BAA5A78